MKKLLLILLCVPLIFSCEEKEDKNNTEEQQDNKSEKGCEKTIPDYTIKEEDFIQSIKNKKDYQKYDGKIIRISINRDEFLSRMCINDTCTWASRWITFHFNNWSKSYEDYNDYLTGENSNTGYIGGRIEIQGTYDGDLNFKDCCWLIPEDYSSSF